MPLVPTRFLFRLSHPCQYVKNMPLEDGDDLLDLPPSCRLDNLATMDGVKNFAEFRIGWNELGIGVQVEVKGKEQKPQGEAAKPRTSDGLALWIDTRDARAGHRATRYCHQFYFLPTGGGDDGDSPVFVQTKVHRAQQDAPLSPASAVPFRTHTIRGGYRIEAFLSGAVLNGFDPDQNRRLGLFYSIRDIEQGEQTSGVNSDFPYHEDPSLWSVLELVN